MADSPWPSKIHHKAVIAGGLIVGFLAAMLMGSTVAPPGGECETRFMQGLFTCFTDFHVAFNSFLWVAGNGTGGVPPDNETQFREQMCSVENDVAACVLDVLHGLVDTPHCHDADGMEALLTVQVRAIFEEYDDYCAHGCRQTLESDMRQCYSNLSLDPTLFLSTTNKGAILGDSESSVSDFCNNREELVTCLETQRDTCPEASHVMKRLGLNLETLSQGLTLLCRHQEAYLSSLDCFGEQTRAVEKCQEDLGLSLKRLVTQTKTQSNINREAFVNKFCLARVQFIKCDLQSWAAKPEEACDTPALALKRDLHCTQLPQQCEDTLQGPIEKVCTYNWAVTSVETTGSEGSESAGLRCLARKEFVLFGLFLVLMLL